MLGAIAANCAVAAIIVTSNSSRTVARWLELHGAANLVHAIVGRDSVLALKPSPEMVARALALASTSADNSGLARSSSPVEKSITKAGNATHTPDAHAATSSADAVFVGDSEADFGAARESGLGFYGIATKGLARDRLIAAGATKIFASPAALRIHLNLTPSESFSDSEPN
jgi:phosphoglycolate phosphatase-like HAD superfamily hydrolase